MPRLTNLAVDYVSLVDRAAVRDPANPSEPQRYLLTKSEVPVFDSRGPISKGDSMPDTEKDLRAQLAKTERKLAKAEKKATKVAKTDSDGADLRAKLAKADKDAKAAADRAQKAEQIAKAERDQRVEREFVAKAEKEFSRLGDPATLGAELMHMSEKLSKQDFESHLKRLAAAEAQLQKADTLLLGQLGRDGEPETGAAADRERLSKRAEEIRKADSTISRYDAMRQALRENPELQAQLLTAV